MEENGNRSKLFFNRERFVMYEDYVNQSIPHPNHFRFERQQYIRAELEKSRPAFGWGAFFEDVILPSISHRLSVAYERINRIYQWWMD